MRSRTMLIKRQFKLNEDKKFADEQALSHKRIYEKFKSISDSCEKEIKQIDEELKEIERERAAHLPLSVDNAIKQLNDYCQNQVKGNCNECKIRHYCLEYIICHWDNVR